MLDFKQQMNWYNLSRDNTHHVVITLQPSESCGFVRDSCYATSSRMTAVSETSYTREKNRRDELTQALGLIQEHEGSKKKERKTITLPLSQPNSQSACRGTGLLGDRRICV